MMDERIYRGLGKIVMREKDSYDRRPDEAPPDPDLVAALNWLRLTLKWYRG